MLIFFLQKIIKYIEGYRFFFQSSRIGFELNCFFHSSLARAFLFLFFTQTTHRDYCRTYIVYICMHNISLSVLFFFPFYDLHSCNPSCLISTYTPYIHCCRCPPLLENFPRPRLFFVLILFPISYLRAAMTVAAHIPSRV